MWRYCRVELGRKGLAAGIVGQENGGALSQETGEADADQGSVCGTEEIRDTWVERGCQGPFCTLMSHTHTHTHARTQARTHARVRVSHLDHCGQ